MSRVTFPGEPWAKVDKFGCIQFSDKQYEVGVLLVGRTVDVAYDPNDLQTLTVEYDNKSWRVQEPQIGEHTGPRPKLPKSMLPALPNMSRLLDVWGVSEYGYDIRYEYCSVLWELKVKMQKLGLRDAYAKFIMADNLDARDLARIEYLRLKSQLGDVDAPVVF